jgi:hypothetical protein
MWARVSADFEDAKAKFEASVAAQAQTLPTAR